MRGSRFIVLAIAALIALLAMGLASAEPSGGCSAGDVPPGMTPLGVGVDQFGDPAAGPAGVRVCNTGDPIPPPAKGAATVQVNPDNQAAFVDVDGDSDNNTAPCTDGYSRVRMTSAGPEFYESPNGGHTGTSQPKSPEVWAQNTVENCAGPLPAP